MEFRLTFPVEPLAEKISYRQNILMAGSCFAENIGSLMAKYKLNAYTNPNGIVYNPVSLATAIKRLLSGEEYQNKELFCYNELWASWQHHGQFSHTDKKQALKQINEAFNKSKATLEEGNWLVVTFGSAYIYRLLSSGLLVANCHKYPNKEFSKELLTVEHIVSEWEELLAQLYVRNPQIKIILTVSPVRYVRDGLVNNNLSKAILLQAVHTLCNKHNNVLYFPAYELVMDDLRDYRFFTEDMVHPNAQAIEYVWEKFVAAAFDDEAQTILNKVSPLVSAAGHRVLNEGTVAHEKFMKAHASKVLQLSKEYPFLNLSDLETAFTKK